MVFVSDRLPRTAPRAQRLLPHPAFDRLLTSSAGGAMLGASLAGKVGAAVGALVGLAVAHRLNTAEQEQAGRGPGIQP